MWLLLLMVLLLLAPNRGPKYCCLWLLLLMVLLFDTQLGTKVLLHVAAAHGGVTFWHPIVLKCCRMWLLLIMVLLMSAATLVLCLICNLMLWFRVYISPCF